jgi:3-oxoacyl-[acyl-carrier protein] reductase
MDLGLAGRVGIVTGAEGGPRAATAALLRAEGAEVVETPASDDPERADVDFLVNFLGDAPAADPRAAFERRVMAPMRAMKALAPRLAERGRGRIVNVVPTADPVTAAAALALSRLFAERYAGRGVLVNALSPAADADPEAVAREVAFLCSERASHIAGTAGVIS